MKTNERFWINLSIILGLLAAAMLLLFLAFQSPQVMTENQSAWSAQNASEDGAKAIYRLLKELGYQTEIWDSSYQSLPKEEKKQTLFILGPQVPPPTSGDYRALVEWVSAGNRLVLFAPLDSKWAKGFDFQSKECFSDSLIRQVTAAEENPWLNQMKTVEWHTSLCIELQRGDEPVLLDQNENVLIGKRKVGEGEIYFVPEITALINGRVDLEDNVAIPLAMAEGTEGTVWFDETVHPWPQPPQVSRIDSEYVEDLPTPDSPTLLQIFPVNGWVMVIQILILAILFLWVRGSRFASPRYEKVKRDRPFFEYIQAMGRWYERSLSKKELLDLLLSRLNEKMKKIHVDANEFHERYQSIVSKVEKAKKRKAGISEATLFALCKQIEQLEREMDQWKVQQSMWKRFKA